jgi:hypothetical protein|tara:strand:+ start:3644 stop:3937 length:294 start_codon:yes stop_codon:yes gene_type:complete
MSTVAENDNAAILFGQKASEVLKNEAYNFAITAMKGDIIAKLAINPLVGDNEASIELIRRLQCITELEDKLAEIMRDGKFVEDSLIAQQNNTKRNKR